MSVQAQEARAVRRDALAVASPVEEKAVESDRPGALSLEAALFAVAVALGMAARLLLLDLRPLSVEEGTLASESYRFLQGQPADTLHQGPLEAFGMVLALAMFAGSDAAARLLPALVGSALVATPYLLRGSLGRTPALLAAYGIALSPLLVFGSRDVGSGVIPTTLGLVLWWALQPGIKTVDDRRAVAVGLLLAGLLTSGTVGINVGLAMAVAALVSHPHPGNLIYALKEASHSVAWRQAALVFAGASLAVGAGFGGYLSGIHWVLVDNWSGWARSFTFSTSRGTLLVVIGLYEAPILLMGLIQVVGSLWQRNQVNLFLCTWALLLLLLSMVQGAALASQVIPPMVPLYFLAARFLAGRLEATGWSWDRSHLKDAALLLLPVLMAIVLMNAATMPSNERFVEVLYVGLMMVGLGAAAGVVTLKLFGQTALAWGALLLLSGAFLLHSSAFLNYRIESVSAEPIVGTQVSPSFRDAAADASYYGSYFAADVAVDPQLRAASQWYLRQLRDVAYSAAQTTQISFRTVPAGQFTLDSGSERRPGTYSPAIDFRDFNWRALWRWLLDREGLVRPNQRDIIVRAPAGNW